MVASFRTAKRSIERAKQTLRAAGILKGSGKGKIVQRKTVNKTSWKDEDNKKVWESSWTRDAKPADETKGANAWQQRSWSSKDCQPANDWHEGSRHWSDAGDNSSGWSDSTWQKNLPPPPPPPKPTKPAAEEPKAAKEEPAETYTMEPAETAAEEPAETAAEELAEQPPCDMQFFLHSSGGFNAKEVDDADVFVNAVVIRSYSNDNESWACCGLNGAILLEVACHPQTMTLIEKFIDDVAALPAGRLACKVHIQCAAGRHRSVALLTLLCDALITVSGKLVHYVHVSESSRPFCGCPNDCSLVANKANQKGWDAEKLRNFWFENGNAAICVFRRIWATALKRRSGSLQ